MNNYKLLKDISGFENAENFVIYDDGSVFNLKLKTFLKLSTDSSGYKYLDLRRYDCEIKCPKLHRLVALAFIPNPENKKEVNHRNISNLSAKDNKLDCRVQNLEWCNHDENMRHAFQTGLSKGHGKEVYQYNLNHNLIAVFNSPKDAMVHLGKDPRGGGQIVRVINGKRKTAFGYIWKDC